MRAAPRGHSLGRDRGCPADALLLPQHGPRSTTQVAVLTGYSSKSGGFRNSLSALRTAGLITGRGDLEVTPAGLDARISRYPPAEN